MCCEVRHCPFLQNWAASRCPIWSAAPSGASQDAQDALVPKLPRFECCVSQISASARSAWRKTGRCPRLAWCFGSSIIRPQDVLNACPKPRLGGYHSSDLMRILAMNASGAALITTNKLINYEEQRDPHTGRKVRTFTPEDLEEFQRKYISLSHVATRLNTLPKHAAARLRARGILPLPARSLCSKIYRRADIDFI